MGQNVVYQIVSTRTVNTQHGQSVIQSLQKGMWYAGERIAVEPYDDGELTVICVVNWTEKEQDWSSVQFISAATVLI